MAHLVQQNPDGVPLYYSPRAGRGVAGGAGWAEKPEAGLAFARAIDAQTFIEYHLPHLQAIATVVEKEIE